MPYISHSKAALLEPTWHLGQQAKGTGLDKTTQFQGKWKGARLSKRASKRHLFAEAETYLQAYPEYGEETRKTKIPQLLYKQHGILELRSGEKVGH